jgi:hypothetical protein
MFLIDTPDKNCGYLDSSEFQLIICCQQKSPERDADYKLLILRVFEATDQIFPRSSGLQHKAVVLMLGVIRVLRGTKKARP